MRIRPFDPGRDEPAVRTCFIALQDHEHDFAPDAPTGAELVDVYVPFMLARCGEAGGHLLVAETDGRSGAGPGDDGEPGRAGQVVGFASVLVRPREEPDDDDLVHAEVAELSVLPGFRGQGIGQALLAEAEVIARRCGATSLRIRVDARNDGARRLYRRAGFEPAVVLLHKPLAGS